MAFISGMLLPFSTISEALPSDPFNLILSYEQSRSMVDYIEHRYGMDSIKGSFKIEQRRRFYETVSDELGTDFTEIEKKWKRDKENNSTHGSPTFPITST